MEHLLEDAFRWIARDGAKLTEVQVWLLKSLRMLLAQDPDRFGPAVRALARETSVRTEKAHLLPSELKELRALVGEIDQA